MPLGGRVAAPGPGRALAAGMTTQAHEWTSFETLAQTRAPEASRATAKAKTRAPRLPNARGEHDMLADVTGAAREKLVDDT